MPSLTRLPIVVIASVWLIGCGSHVPPAAPPPAPTLPVTTFSGTLPGPSVALVPDAIANYIAQAEQNFATGKAELEAGHLVAAREHFDRAVDVLLTVPGGARSDPRLAAEFDRLLDRISALDLIALREGDGFTEARTEPAIIDQLLNDATEDAPAPTLSTEETVTADLAHTPHDLPIPINSKVLGYVELFQGRLRDFMSETLDRSVQYVPMIEEVFKAEGLPLDLAYVPIVESAFKNTALSRASAKGMWQFIQSTAFENGLQQNWFVDERSDPEKATHAAAQYLKSLAEEFDGDWNLALASYNAGPGRVEGAIKRSKTTDYWKMSSSTKYLPRDTREYVPMILAAVDHREEPDAVRLRCRAADAAGLRARDGARRPGPADPRRMGRDLGGRHPGAQPRAAADDDALERARVESADGHRRDARSQARDRRPVALCDLQVLLGQARRHDRERRAAIQADLRRAPRGQRSEEHGESPRRPDPDDSAAARERSAGSSGALCANAAPAASSQATTYRVRPGDTLSSIARHFDTTVDDLKRTQSAVVGQNRRRGQAHR